MLLELTEAQGFLVVGVLLLYKYTSSFDHSTIKMLTYLLSIGVLLELTEAQGFLVVGVLLLYKYTSGFDHSTIKMLTYLFCMYKC